MTSVRAEGSQILQENDVTQAAMTIERIMALIRTRLTLIPALPLRGGSVPRCAYLDLIWSY